MKKIFIIILLFILMSNQSIVQASTIYDNSNKDTKEVEQLYTYITNMKTKYELIKDLDIKDYIKDFMKTGNGKFSFEQLFKGVLAYFFRELIASFKLMIMLLIICVICALLTNLQKAFSNEGLSNIAYFACYSLIIIIVAKSFYIGVNEVKAATNNLTDFMAALVPVLLTLLAAGGGIVQSTIMDPIIILAINVAARIFMDLLLPLILIGFVLQFVNNISEEYKVDRLAKLINQIVLWIQGLVMTVFIAIVTIRGINAKAIDEVTAKTAKFAVDNFVPIVGKALSDAISTVVGYSVVLKNAVSSVGLIVLIAIVIFPIIKVLALALIHKLTAALVQPISDKRIVNCINAAGDTLILLMSCLISISVMFFIMIAIIASSGNVIS